MKRSLNIFAALLLSLQILPPVSFAYSLLDIKDDGAVKQGVWATMPIVIYFDSVGDLPKIAGNREDQILMEALESWNKVDTSNVLFQVAGRQPPAYYTLKHLEATTKDRINSVIYDKDGTITQKETGASREDILGFGIPILNEATGKIDDSIIVINGWIIDEDSLQAVMTHEFGHVIGLDHSGITTDKPMDEEGLPTMYPVKITNYQKSLELDDKVGASVLYPNQKFFDTYGALKGKVSNGSTGEPIFGAHVVAYDRMSGQPVVSTFTGFPQGFKSTRISGRGDYLLPLPPGDYTLKLEAFPLPGFSRPINDGAIDMGSGIGSHDFTEFDSDFATEFYNDRDHPDRADALTVKAAEIQSSVNFTTGVSQESFAYINIEHSFRSDLKVVLGIGDYRNPEQEITLLEPNSRSADGNANFVISQSLADYEKYLPPTPDKPWFLFVYDRTVGDQGRVLDFYIHAKGDQVYYSRTTTPYIIPDDGRSANVTKIDGVMTKSFREYKDNPSHPGNTAHGCGLLRTTPLPTKGVGLCLLLIALVLTYRQIARRAQSNQGH